jgi:hypothetical protein
LEGLAVEDVGVFYSHVGFSRTFGIFCGNWVYFSHFGMMYPENAVVFL